MPRKYAKREPMFPPEDTQAVESTAQEATPVEAPASQQVIIQQPNPAVEALQGDIVQLVRERTSVRRESLEKQAALLKAQSDFQLVQSKMNSLEEEVRYLHSQVAQLEGREPSPQACEPSPQAYQPGVVSIVSVPAIPQQSYAQASGEPINRGHATREMY
jgi:hypothetical protein